jgi:uncharacterized protein YndB with AHSA1/START domain
MNEPKVLRKQELVFAPVQKVWKAWTTREGIFGFFAPRVGQLDVRVGGGYELLFDDEQPPGKQGSEGCKILEVVPERRLSFTWNFPPHLSIRDELTTTTVDLEPAGDKTRVTVTVTGWKEGKDWGEGYGYFERVWPVVLRRLQHYLTAGPVDWKNPPM